MNKPRIILALVFLLVVYALATSETISDRRLKGINAAINTDRIAKIDDASQEKLSSIFMWLTTSAGISKPIAVNGPISKDRLDLVVTTPEFEQLTLTGHGNAIYDPSLDTIFIDKYLVAPQDMLHVGETGPYVQSTLALTELDFVENYLTFIIAHELGHRQIGRKGGAFFAIDWLSSSKNTVDSEIKSDEYAVQLISEAHGTGNAPEFIKENSLKFSGLRGDTPEVLAAGQVFSGLIGMSMLMQFGSGPYSPFFHDEAHPDFLSRALAAVESSIRDGNSLIKGQAPVVEERVRRTKALARWKSKEIVFPGPVARVEWRGGHLWSGIVSTHRGQPSTSPLGEALYRMKETTSGIEFEQVAEGKTTDSDRIAGDWLNRLLRMGAPELGLPTQEWWKTKFGAHRTPWLRKSVGFSYDSSAKLWSWKSSHEIVQISEEILSQAGKQIYGNSITKIGIPYRLSDVITFPVLLASNDHELKLLHVEPSSAKVRGSSFRFKPEEGEIEIDTVAPLGKGWFVLSEASSQDEGEYLSFYWVSSDGELILLDRYPTFYNFIDNSGDHSYGRDLDSSQFYLKHLSSSKLLVWSDTGSVWHVTPKSVNIAFNPGNRALQFTNLGNDRTLIWISNARKGYLVDYSNRIDDIN